MRKYSEGSNSILSPPVLCPVVHDVKNKRKVRSLIEQRLEVLDGLFLTQVEAKLVQEVLVHVTMFDVWDVRIDHERNKVEDEVGRFSQDNKCCETKLIKAGVVR